MSVGKPRPLVATCGVSPGKPRPLVAMAWKLPPSDRSWRLPSSAAVSVFVEAFDEIVQGSLAQYVSLSQKIGGDVQKHVGLRSRDARPTRPPPACFCGLTQAESGLWEANEGDVLGLHRGSVLPAGLTLLLSSSSSRQT